MYCGDKNGQYINLHVLLSKVVLNSRDQQGNLWLP